MFSRFRRYLGFAATIATSATLVLSSGAHAAAEWCEDDPASIIDGHYVSITVIPHIAVANRASILGESTILVVPANITGVAVPLPGELPTYTQTIEFRGKSGSDHIAVRATTIITAPGADEPADVVVVIHRGATAFSPIMTTTAAHGRTNRPIHYTIHIADENSTK